MGAPFLVERGIDPSEEGLGAALIMRLLLDLREYGGYFRSLADQPTMAQALWATVRELRMSGVCAQQLPPEDFESPAKHKEIRALLMAYETFLVTEKRGDMASVYEEALQHPDWCPIQPQDCWTELPDAPWTPLQRLLIETMPGERLAPHAFEIVGSTLPRRFAETKVERIPADPQASPLAFLMAPERSQPVALKLFHAGGRDAEIEEVFRRILISGRSLDQIEIACASDEYAPLVWEKACRYEWPITLGTGLPATLTRPGCALLGLCSWIETDFTAGVLRRLLESGDLTLASVDDLTPGQAARLLLKGEAGWGRATYDISLRRLAKRYHALADDEDQTAEQRAASVEKAVRTERLLEWITAILASVPECAEDNQVPIQGTVDAALSFLAASAAKASALDGAAAIALQDALAELRALGTFRCPLPVALRFIRERVQAISVGRDRSRPGHLHVSRLAQAGVPNRPLLFIVGLEEGRVFPAAVEDPVLLDSERKRISPALGCSSDRIEEAVHSVLTRLAVIETAAGGEVCFSYSCRDLREYRETFPSWLMLQAHRLQTADPSKSYPDLKFALGSPKSCVPESASAALGDAGWWLYGLKLAGAAGKPCVLRQFPALTHGIQAEEARKALAFGEYDGFVPAAGKVLDPCTREQPVSSTQLQKAAECPFRYFLEYGLSLQAVDEIERDRDAWLEPMLRGTELHDLYAEILRKCREEKRKPNLETDLSWLRDRANKRLEVLRREIPPPSDDVFERERQEFLADVELFLRAECDVEDDRLALGFEVSFGRALDKKVCEPLAQAEPIVIDLGHGLRLRLAGRIDRIDQVGPSSFEIIDYKTGGYFEPDWKGVFAGGRRLQHALYGIAAVELLKRKYPRTTIARGIYYFSTAKGQQERKRIDSPSMAATTAVLSDLQSVIASGTFVHAADESACKWCNFGNACDRNVFANAAAKQGDAKLNAYMRLVAHD
jgi:ATP-dependent helicase/nuclease subunit B